MDRRVLQRVEVSWLSPWKIARDKGKSATRRAKLTDPFVSLFLSSLLLSSNTTVFSLSLPLFKHLTRWIYYFSRFWKSPNHVLFSSLLGAWIISSKKTDREPEISILMNHQLRDPLHNTNIPQVFRYYKPRILLIDLVFVSHHESSITTRYDCW